MKWYTPLIAGWTWERDDATGNYSYGTVPYYFQEGLALARFYLLKKPTSFVRKSVSMVKKGYSHFRKNYKYANLVLTSAAALVSYFVLVGVTWNIAFKILKWFKFF